MPQNRWSVSAEAAWRLLTEPMSQEEAKMAADAITAALPHVHAMPVDPDRHLLQVWDRWSVEMLVEALDVLAGTGRPVPQGLIDDLRGWLDRADPYEADDPQWRSG